MRHAQKMDRARRMGSVWPILLVLPVLAGCHSNDSANGMTSFSSKASP